MWKGLASSPVTLTPTDFNATSLNTTQRSIPPGKQLNLTLKFQHPANNTASLYSGTVKFGTNSSCVINFP